MSSQPTSQFSSLPLPTYLFVSSPVPQKIYNNKVSLLQEYRFGLSFTLPLSLSQKWNFRFCKFKKPECSLVTFCIFLLLSTRFSWLTQICISCFVFRPDIHLSAKTAGFRRYMTGTAGIFLGTKQEVYLYRCTDRCSIYQPYRPVRYGITHTNK